LFTNKESESEKNLTFLKFHLKPSTGQQLIQEHSIWEITDWLL